MTVQGRVGRIWRLREGDEVEEDERSVRFDLAFLIPVGSRLYFIGEAGQDENPGYVAPGLRYFVTERVSLAGAVPVGVNDRRARFVVQVQLEVR